MSSNPCGIFWFVLIYKAQSEVQSVFPIYRSKLQFRKLLKTFSVHARGRKRPDDEMPSCWHYRFLCWVPPPPITIHESLVCFGTSSISNSTLHIKLYRYNSQPPDTVHNKHQNGGKCDRRWLWPWYGFQMDCFEYCWFLRRTQNRTQTSGEWRFLGLFDMRGQRSYGFMLTGRSR